MPTFDFSNLVRAFMRLVLFTVRNPILLFSLVASGSAAAAVAITSFFSFGGFVDGWVDLHFSNWECNAIVRILFYVFNVDSFLSVVAFTFRWVSRFFVFLIVFFTSWWGMNLAYTGGHTLRQTIKDLG